MQLKNCNLTRRFIPTRECGRKRAERDVSRSCAADSHSKHTMAMMKCSKNRLIQLGTFPVLPMWHSLFLTLAKIIATITT